MYQQSMPPSDFSAAAARTLSAASHQDAPIRRLFSQTLTSAWSSLSQACW